MLLLTFIIIGIMLLLTGTLISHNVTVVMLKLQGNGVILMNQANSVGSEPLTHCLQPIILMYFAM